MDSAEHQIQMMELEWSLLPSFTGKQETAIGGLRECV
jgi:hypothetical protein